MLIAIDQGTTSTRALGFDTAGRGRVLLSLAHRQHYPQPGWVEHDPEELLANIGACLAAAGAAGPVTAVGLANQGESCLAWDAATGRAISPVIVWQDARTAPEIARLTAEGAEALVLARAGLPLDAYFSASKLGWILREIPQARALAASGRLRLGTTDAFFRARLTGRFETDVATASRTTLMNLRACQWDPDLCRLFGVPIEALPPIGPCAGDLGALVCGDRPAVLAASLVDQQAALYGHGCRKPGDAKITFGTGAFALVLTEGLVQGTVAGPLPTIAWQRPGEAPVHALEGGVYCASSSVNWGRGIGLFDELSQIDGFAAAPAIERGLVFVPALAGLACPHWNRAARGAWLGLSLDTSASDMMQAVLEGVALRMAEVIAAIEALQPVRGPVSIDGGMARNPYFCGFLADVLGRDILASDQPELTALGVAAMAAGAVGAPFAPGPAGQIVAPSREAAGWQARFGAARRAVEDFAASG